ncbi:MAG: hypothetical protein KDI83_17325 [Gammaproteobacteria bacterium]|nr:hypothetical protein [Gammaproteobacteria bacterium]
MNLLQAKRKRMTVWSLGWFGVLLLVGASGCSVPKHMLVESGDDPQNRDLDARFRTTYYFRVFDPCSGVDDASKSPFVSDTLYRFRLTGKAHSLTTAVRFEAGTLTKQQIDPFGANVAFDPESGGFYYQSAGEQKNRALLNQETKALEKHLALLASLEAAEARSPDTSEYTNQLTVYRQLISNHVTRINALAVAGSAASTLSREQVQQMIDEAIKASANGGAKQNGAGKITIECDAARRGFKILGPEGWRTFDQDERLVFAMSTSGEPLISTLQELSGRVLRADAPNAQQLLPMLQEQLRITRAEGALAGFHPAQPEAAVSLVEQVIQAFADERGKQEVQP